jgi:hypothetical protein
MASTYLTAEDRAQVAAERRTAPAPVAPRPAARPPRRLAPMARPAAAPSYVAPTSMSTAPTLEASPAYQAFMRALGVERSQAESSTQQQVDALNRSLANRLPEITQAGEYARRGISGALESRGLFRSGEHETALAGQRQTEAGAVSGLQDETADRIAGLRQSLAERLAGFGRAEAEQGLSAAQSLAEQDAAARISAGQQVDYGTPAPVSRGTPARLASFGGYQFDANVLPRVQGLAAAVPGLRVSSGYRTPEQNRRANGVSDSAHLRGTASDFVGSMDALQRGAAWARANGARQVLIHNAGSGVHLHVSW